MGNRITVSISNSRMIGEPEINVYAHWLGDDAYDIVIGVLEDTQRIGDPYLTAQIIHALMERGYSESDGTGIAVFAGPCDTRYDDNEPMFVDIATGTYHIGIHGDEVNPNG